MTDGGRQWPVALSQYSRRRVAELRDLHPDWTLEEIAGEVGVTRERVRQLLVAQHLRTTADPLRNRWGRVDA